MGNKDLVNLINSELGSHRSEFLYAVRSNVYDFIYSQSCSKCLSVVERKSINVIWEPSDALDGYIPRFISFLRKKKYDGNELDSALTDPVVNIVVTTYNKFIEKKSGLIVKPIIEDALNNRIVIGSIARKAVETWQGYIPQYMKQKLMSSLVTKLKIQ